MSNRIKDLIGFIFVSVIVSAIVGCAGVFFIAISSIISYIVSIVFAFCFIIVWAYCEYCIWEFYYE